MSDSGSDPIWRDELHDLCEAALEERLSPEQRERLEQLVLGDLQARRYYVEHVHQHASLFWPLPDSAERGVRSAERESAPATLAIPNSRPGRGWFRWVASMAAAVFVATGIGYAMHRPTAATLASVKGCKWDGGNLPTEEGARLGAGRIRLAEGIARIEFDGGAEVTLEGPADLEIVSSGRCVLHGGRLVANVPPRAIGFKVETPTAMLIDQGTEFGVHVRDSGTADVQVFNGIVDAQHRSSGQTERLQTGRNRRFATGEVSDFDPREEKPAGEAVAPTGEGTRVVHLSTALGAGKDAYVQPLYPSKHHSDVLLLVKNSGGVKSDYNRKAYFAIDLSSLAGQKVLDAQLSLTFAPTGMGFASQVPDATFAIYGLTDESLDSWDDQSVRWNNAPANRPGGVDLDPAKTVKLGTFTIAQGVLQGNRSIAGPALAEFLNRDTNQLATFILVRETAGSGREDLVHGFASRKHATLPPPTLRVMVEGK